MFIKFYVIGTKGTLHNKVCKHAKGRTNPINAKENVTNKHWMIYTVKFENCCARHNPTTLASSNKRLIFYSSTKSYTMQKIIYLTLDKL
jgi:hypothetical protein